MKQAYAYKLDLTKIDGTGDFSCPKCGAIISPDDATEETYALWSQRSMVMVWKNW